MVPQVDLNTSMEQRFLDEAEPLFANVKYLRQKDRCLCCKKTLVVVVGILLLGTIGFFAKYAISPKPVPEDDLSKFVELCEEI